MSAATSPSTPGPRRTSRGRWASVSAVRGTLGRFRDDWRALPGVAWRRWLAALVVGFVLCAIAVAGMTLWAKRAIGENPRALERDALQLRAVADTGPISFPNAILLESFGNLAYMVPLTLACFAVAARRGRPLLALSFVATYALQRPLVMLGWQLWNRDRPDLIAAGIAAPGLHSFPSGHAALTFSLYGLLAWLCIRASRSLVERLLVVVLFAALVVVVGVSRVALGTHWPSDIIAGWVVGLCWLITILLALRRAERAGGA